MKNSTIVLIGVAAIVVTLGYFFFRSNIQVALTPPKIIKEFSCGQDYTLQIKEGQEVIHGTFDTPYPTYTNIFRNLNLVHSGKVIASINHDGVASYAYGNAFPAGEAFLQVYVFDKQAITPGNENRTVWAILKVPTSQISATDFKNVSECLYQNRSEIHNLLIQTATPEWSSDGSLKTGTRMTEPVGWTMLVDDSVKRDSFSDAPEFDCADGKMIVTRENSLLYEHPFGTIGALGPDGTIYKMNGPGVDTTQPKLSLPNVECKNSNGETLKQFLSSIPSRISIGEPIPR